MTEQESNPNRMATPDEQERAAEVESYTGVPMDDQELADVWIGGQPKPSDAGSDADVDVDDPQSSGQPVPEEPTD